MLAISHCLIPSMRFSRLCFWQFSIITLRLVKSQALPQFDGVKYTLSQQNHGVL